MSEDTSATYEYYGHRGITASTFAFYGAKSKIDGTGAPTSIGYVYPSGATKVRSLTKKDFKWVGETKAGLFGIDKFASGSHKFVTITEGEYDALSLYQVLHSPCVSVRSSSSARSDCSADREWLSGFDRIYLAFDNDVAGREAVRSVAKLFDFNKVFLVKFSNRKDANEYLQAGEGDELRNIWWNAKKYVPDNVVHSFSDFEKILKEETRPAVSYPWPFLTKMTYGIRTGETVLVTAQEKVGKTAFMHAILHHLLKETDDAIGAFFLEEPKKQLLQSLAGLEVGSPLYLPDKTRPPAAVFDTLKTVLKRDERLYVYDYFGSDNPEVLLDAIRFLVSACGCRYILLDHLTMVFSGLADQDERRAIDQFCTRLEMMVKELDFSLIMVSHVNDEGKTRGSRYPTKVSDITISLHRDLMHVVQLERNTLQVSVPFNRYCGFTGLGGYLLFDQDTYTYSERMKEDNDNARHSNNQAA